MMTSINLSAWDTVEGWTDEDEKSAMDQGWVILANQKLPEGITGFAIKTYGSDIKLGAIKNVLDNAMQGGELERKAIRFIARYSPHHLIEIARKFPITTRTLLGNMTQGIVAINYSSDFWGECNEAEL